MADRYWVGGTGTWGGGFTTNWSTTSGGPGGASQPTASDNVYFDSNSGSGTVSVGNGTFYALSFNFSTNSITFSGLGFLSNITVRGTVNITGYASFSGGFGVGLTIDDNNASSGSYSHTLNGTGPRLTVFARSASHTLSGNFFSPDFHFLPVAGKSFVVNLTSSNQTYRISSAGQPSALSIPATWRASNLSNSTGSFSFSPNNISSSSFSISASSGASITSTLPSTITTSSFSAGGAGTVTINSSLTINAGSVTVATSSLQNLTLTGNATSLALSTNLTSLTYNSSSTSNRSLTILSSGTGTIGTLTLNQPSQSGVPSIVLGRNMVVSTLSLNGNASYKINVISSSAGTQRKLQATSFSLANIYWKDIDADGTVPFTGTGFQDGGNNLDITFSVPGSGLFFGSNF